MNEEAKEDGRINVLREGVGMKPTANVLLCLVSVQAILRVARLGWAVSVSEIVLCCVLSCSVMFNSLRPYGL